MKREKTKATDVRVPQNRDEAAGFVAEIGHCQRARSIIETGMNARIAEIKADSETRARRLAAEIEELSRGLEIWAAANREALTDGGKSKTATLASGEIKWRMTPPAVNLRGVADILKELFAKGLDQFIRTKHEIDKEAILRAPEEVADVPGISIGQHEEFVIVPFETKLEEVR
jgi:phage host-nuclease inhibitor protein Gam